MRPTAAPGCTLRDGADVPPWACTVAVPTWVCDPERRLSFVNEEAEKLLGVRADEVLGRPCHEVVGPHWRKGDRWGPSVERNQCPLADAVPGASGSRIHEGVLEDGRGNCHWVGVLTLSVPTADGSGQAVVHFTYVLDRIMRMCSYVRHVAARTTAYPPLAPSRVLTPRELQVLDLLCADLDSRGVATRLGITYATVRNHIQHLLAKLDAHSIEEAVARRLIDPSTRRGGRGR